MKLETLSGSENNATRQWLFESFFADAYSALDDYDFLEGHNPNIDVDLFFHDDKVRICKVVAEEMTNKMASVADSVDFDGNGAWSEMVKTLISVVSESFEKALIETGKQERKPRDFKVNRADGFDEYVLCEMYKLQDDESFSDGKAFDIGNYSTKEWIDICHKATNALFDDIERRANANDMGYPFDSGVDEDGYQCIDYIYEVGENGPKIMEKVLKEDWEKRYPVEEYEFTVTANAFMTLKAKGRNREEAKEEANRILRAKGFVPEHYTEFEIEDEAVMYEDL